MSDGRRKEEHSFEVVLNTEDRIFCYAFFFAILIVMNLYGILIFFSYKIYMHINAILLILYLYV